MPQEVSHGAQLGPGNGWAEFLGHGAEFLGRLADPFQTTLRGIARPKVFRESRTPLTGWPSRVAAPVEEHLLVCEEWERLVAWDDYVAAMRAALEWCFVISYLPFPASRLRSPCRRKDQKMNKIRIATLMCSVVTLQTAFSQQKKEDQTKPTELPAAVCRIDATNKTIRVLPWDGQAKRWKRDSIKDLAWDEQTKLVSSGNTLTMPQFLGGKALSESSKDATSIQGNRAVLYIKTIDGKEVVQRMEMMALFGGESFPAMVGSSGAVMLGGSKVSCGDGSR